MHYYKMITMLMMAGLLQFCSTSRKSLDVVDEVNLERYTGTWYEIARLPNRFEKGLKCVTATYKLRDDGRVTVINRGHKIEETGKVEEAKGVALIPNRDEPGKLKVTFFWPFSGKYWIIKLDEEYRHALVGSPSRKYLWILARGKQMDEATYNRLLEQAESKGFDVSRMIRTEQDCGNSKP